MFHIDCPRFRGFMTWDDLGCLARAVGFPTDLFKSNITKHVTVEEHGMEIEQVNKMLDLRLLQRSIHRTRNLHTGEWNTKVIRKALYLMDHHALTFEELYNIRIAYKAFEGNDMRGMQLDERTMLSALKMCGRSIAPLKMMHRIKHMSVNFEEPDRMQLFEFLDLVLWADLYEEFTFESMERAEGKEGDLFKLVDFDRLLSHHDKKLADRLNNEYLQEEWDFGLEKLEADKSKFKEPPVICGETRIQMAREQKLKYRYLKSELVNSHRKMYRAKAGYIRERPVTAPDLSMYEEEKAAPPPPEFTAQTAYEIVQRKVKSANAAVGRTRPDLSDKPNIPSPQKIWSEKVVSDAELEETQKNYDLIKFDIETVQGRFDYYKNIELEYFFPGHSERLTKQKEEKEESVTADTMKKAHRHPSKPRITQKEVDRLAYPPSRIPPSHAKVCDARLKEKLIKLAERFRGWHSIKHKKGSHFVLVAPSFENSYTGRLHKKLVETSNVPVKKIKGDFVHRFTKKTELEKPLHQEMRPTTAPANLQTGEGTFEKESVVSMTESPADSCKTVDTGYGSMEEGSSAESLSKTPEALKAISPTQEQKRSCPKPFENQNISKKGSGKSESSELKEKGESMEKNSSGLKTPKSSSPGTVELGRPKSSPGLVKSEKSESSKVTKNVNAISHKSKDIVAPPNSYKNHEDISSLNLNGIKKNGLNKTVQKQIIENSKRIESTSERESVTNIPADVGQIDINAKIENYKKDLKKYTLEKKALNNERNNIQSPPPLQFTFTSFVNSSTEDDNFLQVDTKAVKNSKSTWFEEDELSPEIISPRLPEPTIYTKKPKEKIDIENLPVPHLEYSKPKTISVGTIGKISLLESITESTFWEDMLAETYSKKKDEIFVDADACVNPKENELAELKEEDSDDDVSNDSGICSYDMKEKLKIPKKRVIKGDNVDDKLLKAKEDRLKRQKRVLKKSNLVKMGITVVKIPRGSKTSTSSERSNNQKDSSIKEPISSKSSINSKPKNDKSMDLNRINIEVVTNDDKPEVSNINNRKSEEKQKKFCASMKRLVKRMEGTMSHDLQTKMLATRLSGT